MASCVSADLVFESDRRWKVAQVKPNCRCEIFCCGGEGPGRNQTKAVIDIPALACIWLVSPRYHVKANPSLTGRVTN